MTNTQRSEIERVISTAIVEGILHQRNAEMRREPRTRLLKERRQLVTLVADEIESILKDKGAN